MGAVRNMFGIVGTVRNMCGNSKVHLGTFVIFVEQLRIFWEQLGTYVGTVRNLCGIVGTIRNMYGNSKEHVWEQLGTFVSTVRNS